MTVSTLLKNKEQNLFTITQSHNLQDVCKILAEKRIGVLLVCDKNGIIEGIISERDIVKALGNSGNSVMAETVGQHMTANPVTCSPIETINQIMAKMTTGRFRHIPVVKDNKLIAVISIGDIVKARMEAMEAEARAMQEYIGG